MENSDGVGLLITKNKIVFISNEDEETITKFKWNATIHGNKFYATRYEYKPSGNRMIYMHRMIMGVNGGEVDHINGDPLDNRRENLRVVTHQQNHFNMKKMSTIASSKYRGVCWSKDHQSWIVQIRHNGHSRLVTCIESEKIAAMIYDLLAIDRFGEYANLNFPELRRFCDFAKSLKGE